MLPPREAGDQEGSDWLLARIWREPDLGPDTIHWNPMFDENSDFSRVSDLACRLLIRLSHNANGESIMSTSGYLSALSISAVTLALLLNTAGCSAESADDQSSGGAAVTGEDTNKTEEKSVTLKKKGDSTTFDLKSDAKNTAILTLTGTGLQALGLCASPYHPTKDGAEQVANVKIEYDGVTKYSECEANILFDKATTVKITNLADWNDREGNAITITVRNAAVGSTVDDFYEVGLVRENTELCNVANDECGAGTTKKQSCRPNETSKCMSTPSLLTIRGPIKPDGFGQAYGFCGCE